MNPAIEEILAHIPRKLANLQEAASKLDATEVHHRAAELELAASAIRYLTKERETVNG